MKDFFRQLDRPLLFYLALLLLFGSVMLYSASSVQRQGGLEWGVHQLLRRGGQIGVGIFFLAVLALIDRHWIHRLTPAAWALSMGLLVLVLFTSGSRGTRGWLIGESLQPVEAARVACIVLMARLLAAREGLLGFWPRFRAPMIVLGATVLLVTFQPDFGSAMAVGLCGALLLVAAGLPRRMILAGLLGLLLVSAAGYQLSGRIRERVDWTYRVDPTQLREETYQLGQSLIGLGAGGLTGAGPGASRQKTFFLPDHHTDFIYAIVGEELGLIGSLGVLTILLLMAWRMVRIGFGSEDPFARYLSAGLGSMVFVYASLNMAVATGLFPLTGLPLPFFSNGGSALVMNMAAVGMVLGVSRGQRPVPRRRRESKAGFENLFREARR